MLPRHFGQARSWLRVCGFDGITTDLDSTQIYHAGNTK
jgi:hypothetical protein